MTFTRRIFRNGLGNQKFRFILLVIAAFLLLAYKFKKKRLIQHYK